MLIYLLRHGDAVQSPEIHDSERPLSELGRTQAAVVGAFLKSISVHPEMVFSSPLLRAVQTAETVGKLLSTAKIQLSEYLVPGTKKDQLLDQLNQVKPNSVLLVSHEPYISQAISLLLSERETLPVEIRKCSLACVLASDPVRKGHAMLQWLVTAEQMQLLTHRQSKS